MKKIKFITDSASDIPEEELLRFNIEMMKFPITVDGICFHERDDFTFDEFYQVLENAKEIPKTSRISELSYFKSYERAFAMGFDHVINITINAKGSSTHNAGLLARKFFFEEHPDAKGKLEIHVIDSRSYSVAYGYAIIKAAEMAQGGATITEILTFLNDWFTSLEIYAGCYTLKYAGKSGRIHFATAFVGEILGMRPIISLINGDTGTVAKIRGDKNIPIALMDQFRKDSPPLDQPIIIIYGNNPEDAKGLQAMFKKEYKITPPMYQAGAAIVINIGPRVLGLVYKGKDKE